MAVTPIITFKAGICDFNQEVDPAKVVPQPAQGYIYLYSEDDLVHFCWRTRSAPLSTPAIDLIMFPGDGRFIPYEGKSSPSTTSSNPPTNGRIYVLKFSSSSQRHFFWLQSKSQHPQGNPSFFSPRDVKLGQLVDLLLQGEEVDVEREIANIPKEGGEKDDDDDETMEDADDREADHHRASSGGAGAGATGGDFREEGEGAREGGADGGRAAGAQSTETTAAAVANFLQSLQGNQKLGSSPANLQGKPFTTLPDLLPPSTTLAMLETAPPETIDNLLSHVPPILLLLAQEIDDLSGVDPTSETAQAAIAALSSEQKKDVLTRVLRSPQFNQSLGSLTVALRDGGLPAISEALGIRIEGGYVKRGGMMIAGGEAVEAFLKGVRDHVLSERKGQGDGDGDGDRGMDLS